MVSARITASDLPDYYRQLVAAQCAAHGRDYCDHHAVIREAAAGGCLTYAELGVNQGATLAAALLAGFRSVGGVDIALTPLRASEGHFRAYARAHSQHLSLWEQDSRLPIGEVDFLLIDSTHTASHLRQELAIHGYHVKRQLLIHDTAKVPGLRKVALSFADFDDWTVLREQASGFGWLLLSRNA